MNKKVNNWFTKELKDIKQQMMLIRDEKNVNNKNLLNSFKKSSKR